MTKYGNDEDQIMAFMAIANSWFSYSPTRSIQCGILMLVFICCWYFLFSNIIQWSCIVLRCESICRQEGGRQQLLLRWLGEDGSPIGCIQRRWGQLSWCSQIDQQSLYIAMPFHSWYVFWDTLSFHIYCIWSYVGQDIRPATNIRLHQFC